MKFDKVSKKIIRIQKHGYSVLREENFYCNEDFPLFGLVKGSENWYVVHIPSERPIISRLNSKSEAEEFLELLSEGFDLNCLILFTPKFEDVKVEIEYDVEIAYRKLLKKKHQVQNEKNNNF